jgi:hypothetical protein
MKSESEIRERLEELKSKAHRRGEESEPVVNPRIKTRANLLEWVLEE